MEHKTITAVSKQHDCSHKFSSVTSAVSTASPLRLLLLFFCHCVPPRVYVVQSNFQANRLRRLPVAPSNPLTGFQNSHACSMHFHSRRSRLYTRILSNSSAVLSTASPLYDILSGRADHTKLVVDFNTAHGGMQAVPLFCKISVSTLGHGCTS